MTGENEVSENGRGDDDGYGGGRRNRNTAEKGNILQ